MAGVAFPARLARQGAAAQRVYIKDHGLMTVKWLA